MCPHLTFFQLVFNDRGIALKIVAFEVHTDTSITVFERESIHNHDEDEKDRERDSDPDDIRGGVDTFPHNEVHNDPDSKRGKVNFPSKDRRVSNDVLGVHFCAILIDRLDNVSVEYSIFDKRECKISVTI